MYLAGSKKSEFGPKSENSDQIGGTGVVILLIAIFMQGILMETEIIEVSSSPTGMLAVHTLKIKSIKLRMSFLITILIYLVSVKLTY